MKSNEFRGFYFRVCRDGDAVDIQIKMRVDCVDDWSCRELSYEVGRILYWVVDGCLDEISRHFSPHIYDYEDKLVSEAYSAWSEVEAEYMPDEPCDEDSEPVYSYDERIYSARPKVRKAIIKAIVDNEVNYY